MIAYLVAALVAGENVRPPGPLYDVLFDARLYHQDKGTFSDNLLDQSGRFAGWNSAMSAAQGGPSFWDRGDIMVVIKIRRNAEPDLNSPRGAVTIKATVKGKVIALRKFTGINFNQANPYSLPLWLSDVGCAGAIEVTAKVEGKTEKAILDMECGE